MTVYASGPMPDPCTMLAEMLAVDDFPVEHSAVSMFTEKVN